MESAEGEAAQSGNAGQAGDENILRLAEALDAAQEREPSRIDTALDAVEEADSREAAVAALTRATVGINALYASPPVAVPPETLSPRFDLANRTYFTSYSNFLWWHPQPEVFGRKWDERIERYMRVVNDLVEKYGPDQYQVSVGFPQLISVTLAWNKSK
jgi:hypothetical protein